MQRRDQASNLRQMMQNSADISYLKQEESTEQNDEMLSSPATLYTIAVTGGKGGVGKTNIAANLALAMTQFGKRVGIFDADLGLANIDVLFRLNPRYT
ncbi:MAG: P-loop NTPase, partial [Candidatus Poribacteria bacterium]